MGCGIEVAKKVIMLVNLVSFEAWPMPQQDGEV